MCYNYNPNLSFKKCTHPMDALQQLTCSYNMKLLPPSKQKNEKKVCKETFYFF